MVTCHVAKCMDEWELRSATAEKTTSDERELGTNNPADTTKTIFIVMLWLIIDECLIIKFYTI